MHTFKIALVSLVTLAAGCTTSLPGEPDANPDFAAACGEEIMALPLSRDKTFVPGDPVLSATLNNLQDGLVNKSHGEVPCVIPGAAAASNTPSDALMGTAGKWIQPGATAGKIQVPFEYSAGTRILGFTVYGRDGAGGNTFSANLKSLTFSTGSLATEVSLKTSTAVSGANSLVFDENDVGLPITVAITQTLHIDISLDSTDSTTEFWGAVVRIDHP